jgi:hypothetical protein
VKLLLTIFFFICSIILNAQDKVKIKREDNRFLFYQIGNKNDTIILNKSDLFFIKLPDSLKHNLQINVSNGLFKAIHKDSLTYLLQIVKGMKYSHTKPDSLFMTLLEGNCIPSHQIKINFLNTKTQKVIFKNTFFTK